MTVSAATLARTWTVDPDDPRCPPMHIWNAMTPDERRKVLDELPPSPPQKRFVETEGDEHFEATSEGREVLRTFFERENRRVYVGANMTVYYPDETAITPDLMAVTDVDPGKRASWVVATEGKGPEWVMEVLVHGDRKKDRTLNVLRYANLGIGEYFLFDRRRNVLKGYHLTTPDMRMYTPLLPKGGEFYSRTLGLSISLKGGRVRFRRGEEDLLLPRELAERLETKFEEVVARAEQYELLLEETLQAAEEAERRTDEALKQAADATKQATDAVKRAADAEQRVRELESELERLRRGG